MLMVKKIEQEKGFIEMLLKIQNMKIILFCLIKK